MFYLSPDCVKISDQSDLPKEGSILAHSLVGPVGKSWLQEGEAAGSAASTVRRQSLMGAGAQLMFSFLFSMGILPVGWCLPHSG